MPTGESMTVPSETMTIQEILQKHAAGLVDLDRNNIYLDAELEEIDRFHGQPMDLTDLDALAERIEVLNKSIEDSRAQILLNEEAEESQGADDEGGSDGKTEADEEAAE